MKRSDIEAPGVYEVALSRSGRGGRRIHNREIVHVSAIERSPHYRDSVQYEVTYERALVKGVVKGQCATRDVLRVATAEEVTAHERNRRQALELGWIDERLNKES